MNLNIRARRREDPEINLINFIDVLLVLLIFFMVSTTFNQEGRVKVQLPQASAIPIPNGTHEPLVITVTAEGGYRVNERTLINSSPDTLRAAILKEAGADRGPITIRRMRGRPTRRSSPRWMSRAGSASPSSTSPPCTRTTRLERDRRRSSTRTRNPTAIIGPFTAGCWVTPSPTSGRSWSAYSA